MPQLDGLRAYAVLAVLLHHLFEARVLPSVLSLGWGTLGVRLFFVLSGFLITGLLIRARDEVEASGVPRRVVLGHFYLRRALRIFPIYYLVLVLTLIWGPPDAHEQLPWLATYTYNLWISHLGRYPGYFSHFWSLCVEEQFYLLWPFVVMFAPRRHVPFWAVAMIVAAPVYRVLALIGDINGVAFYTLTPSSLDALGMGALLATCTHGRPASRVLEKRLRWGSTALVAASVLLWWQSPRLFKVLYETLLAMIFAWLVAGASRGFVGWARIGLQARPIVYLGKISYGVYVYHLLMLYVVPFLFQKLGIALPDDEVARFLLYSGITIAVASVSWVAFEAPINRLKRHVS